MSVNASPNGGSALSRRWSRRLRPPRLLRLALKELRETLRDRRTIATLLLMPILVYPLLSIAFQRFLITNLNPAAANGPYAIGFLSEEESRQVGAYLLAGNALLAGQEHPGKPSPKTTQPLRAESDIVPDLNQAVADGRVDVAIRVSKTVPFPAAGNVAKAIDCELIFNADSALSREVKRWVDDRFHAVNERSLSDQLRKRGIRRRVEPVVAESRSIEAAAPGIGRGGGPSLAALVPLILILMTITGAVYPAIDLTAGERERGTLEMLVAAPVPRMQLLLAKYMAVLTVALLTAVVNLAAMIVTVVSIGLGHVLFGDQGASVRTLLEIGALLVLFAGFFSAVLLAVTSFARSFKEAQAYLIPLMLTSIAPGMLSMIPDLKLQGALVVTPLVNIVLLARDLMLHHGVEPATTFWVVLSTGLFALAAIGVAARIFGTDAILYGGHGTWSDLFSRSRRLSDAPTPTSALMCLALIFPAYFLASNLLAHASTVSISGRLILAALVTVLVFLQIPLATAVLNRVDIAKGFQLRPVSPWVLVGAFLLGLSLWPFAHEALVLLNRWDLVSLDPRVLEAAKGIVEKIQQASPVLVITTLAIVPAVCEEFFFRGFLLAALRKSLTETRAIVFSSVLFGVFHLVAIDQLHFERLVPSTLLGLVLGWLCVRCGSVLPGMLLHASHNSLLLLAATYQTKLAAWGLGLDQSASIETAGLPASWIVAGGLGAAIGFAIIQLATRRPRASADPA